MKNENAATPERVFVHAASFEAGIVPMETTNMDVRRSLKDIPPEDARKMKRKFRKLWRKLARQESQRLKLETELVNPTNSKNPPAVEPPKEGRKPSKRAKLRRKQLVQSHILRTAVWPMLEKFRKIERK